MFGCLNHPVTDPILKVGRKNDFRRLMMPSISMCYGILIKMFYEDHAPLHLHEEYGKYELFRHFTKQKTAPHFGALFVYTNVYNMNRF